METKINLTEFLTAQEIPSYLCIIKPIPNEPDKVRMTRYLEKQQTLEFMQYADLNKDLIDFVKATEYFHFIEDKKYEVVEVFFKENATVSVADFINISWRKRIILSTKKVREIIDSL
jgi:hypothetical protein